MASSLAVKRFLSSNNLLSNPLLCPVASRSFNTNSMRLSNSDELKHSDIPNEISSFPSRIRKRSSLSDTRGGVGAGLNAKETEDALHLRVDMSGLSKEDAKISVKQNTLTIKGEGAKESEEEEEGYNRSPRTCGTGRHLPGLDQVHLACGTGHHLHDVFEPFTPTRSLSQILNMVDQVDNPFLFATRGIRAGGVRRGWDAKETEDALHLRVDMPGLGKEDVKISVEQNILTIKGEGEGVRRFSSRIDLPEKLYKIDEIKAEMKNGVLKVIVPKMKEEEWNYDVIDVKIE